MQSLFSNFQRSDCLPKSADWTALFDWIVESDIKYQDLGPLLGLI